MTNQQKFIEAYGVDTWRQIIASSGNAEQFKEFWTSPYCRNEKKWIPCTPETMPEEGGYYYCTCKDGVTYRTTFVKWQTRLNKWDLSGQRSYWKVIAFQPLPEPYKPEEKY